MLIPGGALAAIIGLSAVAAAGGGGAEVATPAAASPSPTPTPSASVTTQAPVIIAMPDLVGMNLQEAQDALQALGSYVLDQEDASGEGRVQLLDSNWRVCSQNPVPETEMPIEATVLLAAVKLDEACPGEEPADTDPAEAEAEDKKEKEEPAEEEKPREEASDLSVAKQNALRSAESYLAFSAFSRSGLIDQLEYEGYATGDAKYAVDAVGANWKDQAAKSAKSYLSFTAFSHSGLIEQLEYEGFTNEQAKHGANAVNANWNEQAAKSAKSYLEFTSFSRSGLIDQLKYEGFTTEQATYAANQVGL